MSESLQKQNSFAAENLSYLGGIVFALLCAMLVVSTVAFGAVDVWALGVNAFLAGLVIIFWTADAWLKKEFRFGTSSLQIPILGLILIGSVQLLPLRSLTLTAALLSEPAADALSFAPYTTRLAIIQLVIYFVFFAAAQTYVSNADRLRKLVTVIIGFSAVMAFYGILQQLADMNTIYGLRPARQAVPFASFVNRHHFAAFMEMTIGLTLGLLFGKKAIKNDKRIFLLIAVVIMGTALIFTNSRGAMISLLAVIGFIVTTSLRQKTPDETESEAEAEAETGSRLRNNTVYVGGGLILLVILFGSVLLLGGGESLVRGVGLSNPNEVSNGRFHFWQIAWQIFSGNPLLGAGLDTFGTLYPHYDSWNGTLRIEQAHNDYLQILADAGILGFACIAAFIYLLFKKSPPVMSKASDYFGRAAATGALAGCLGILVHSFFDFPLRTPSNAFFFLTLTVIATNLLSPQKISRKRRMRPAAPPIS